MLSVEEHLRLFGALKGLAAADIERTANWPVRASCVRIMLCGQMLLPPPPTILSTSYL